MLQDKDKVSSILPKWNSVSHIPRIKFFISSGYLEGTNEAYYDDTSQLILTCQTW